jgi:hypothetical protein
MLSEETMGEKQKRTATFFLLIGLTFFAMSSEIVSAQARKIYSIVDYYQLADGNQWRYTPSAPDWKGDYITRIETAKDKAVCVTVQDATTQPVVFKHFDGTNAAKVLCYVAGEGIYYSREDFADGQSYVQFDEPVLLFPEKLIVGQKIQARTGFLRYYKDYTQKRGVLVLKQTIVAVEEVTVAVGTFKDCLRIESEMDWDLGDGKKARNINIYHYAPNVGVVKASARFIVINEKGVEVSNKLVETDLKAATVGGKAILKQ